MIWRYLISGLVSLLAIAIPAIAQGDGRAGGQDNPQLQRSITDMVFWTVPPSPEGHCIVLDPGRLTVTLQLVGDDPLRSVSFFFYGYRRADMGATIGPLTLDGRAVSTFTAPLVGGLYCYELQNLNPVARDAPNSIRDSFPQQVALRMVLALQQ